MKKNGKFTGFLSGILVSALLMATIVPVLADSLMTIQAFSGVKVYVDDVLLNSSNTGGNPQAFICNGTTYVAVAAVSESLGQPVKWDGNTKSVYIGNHKDEAHNLLDICPPYQLNHVLKKDSLEMAGKKYFNCLALDSYNGFSLFNLNGQYDELTFTLGHVDGKSLTDGELLFYLDGELALSLKLDPEALPAEYHLPLNGALQLKIQHDHGSIWAPYGLADLKVR